MSATGGGVLYASLVYAALATAVVSSLGMLLVPVVSEEMSVPTSTAQWIITGNLLLGALVSPTAGRLSDGHRRKALLLGLLALALIGSVIAALAPSFGVLLIGRVLQGFAYGIVPVTIALARAHLPRERKAAAVATLATTVSMGLGIGYPLTGLAVGAFGLHAAFWVAVGFILSAMVVVTVSIPRDGEAGERRPFDLRGAILLGAALASLVLAIAEAPVWGWTAWPTVGLFALGVVLTIGWLRSARRPALPFVDVASLRIPAVLVSHLSGFVLAATVYLAMSTASLVAQAPASTGYGQAIPVLWAGLVILPLSIGSFAAGRVVAPMLHRFRLITLYTCGALSLAAGAALLLSMHDALWHLLLGMLLVGAGMGAVFGVGSVIVARGVPLAEVGSAVGFNQVLRTIGGTLGSAVAGSVFAASLTSIGFPSQRGVSLAMAVGVALAAVAAASVGVFGLITRAKGSDP